MISNTANNDYIYNAKIIQWTSFNKPKHFAKNNNNDTTTFVYAPNRSRYQKTQTKASSNTTITTTYIGKLYEQIKQNTSTEHKHFIYADGQLIAINIKTDTTAGTPSIPDKTRYLHYDNLGSIDTITNGQGNIVERMAYTAFGQRRQGDWRASDPLLPIIPALTNRGFTGHEHIDEMGFIHMNGRVYDPSIGRFLSADPNIQAPYSTQSYNRYSYVINNPLKYNDPSGYFWGWIATLIVNEVIFDGKYRDAIISIATVAILGPIAGGFVNGYKQGGLEGGIKGAIFAYASSEISSHIGGHGSKSFVTEFANKGVMEKAIAHGLSQGALSQIAGGDFKSGFIGGSISSLSGGYMEGDRGKSLGISGRTAIAATAGGVAAELGGSKFANGAMSAAFVHLFNAENLAEKWQCMGECHGTGYGDIDFMPETEQRALAGDVALGLATLPVGGGLSILSKAGYSLKIGFYRHGGGGLNINKHGVRKFGIDLHKFKYQNIHKTRLHYHRGKTKSQMKKHRPYQGGW